MVLFPVQMNGGGCTVTFNKLLKPSWLLLHYHNTLDHMEFKAIKALACQIFLPKRIVNTNAVACATYQVGKSNIKPVS